MFVITVYCVYNICAGELTRYDARAKILDKHTQVMEYRQRNVINRINKSLAEMTAYKKVVDEEFKVRGTGGGGGTGGCCSMTN